MGCSVVLTKVPADPVGALELEKSFRVVPSDSVTDPSLDMDCCSKKKR